MVLESGGCGLQYEIFEWNIGINSGKEKDGNVR